jgi:hypothetical protein
VAFSGRSELSTVPATASLEPCGTTPAWLAWPKIRVAVRLNAPAQSRCFSFWVSDHWCARSCSRTLFEETLGIGSCYGLAGINHILQKHKNRFETVAMVSDLFASMALLGATSIWFFAR